MAQVDVPDDSKLLEDLEVAIDRGLIERQLTGKLGR